MDGSAKNLADQVQRVARMPESIIRSVMIGGAPENSLGQSRGNIGITLYSEEHLSDITRFCCTGLTPLSFDKTFNLGELFVTPSTYKNLAVTLNKSGDHPIMLGPTYIHSWSTFEAYNPFFSSLSSSLRKIDTSNLVIGTDNETAPRQAIRFKIVMKSATRYLDRAA